MENLLQDACLAYIKEIISPLIISYISSLGINISAEEINQILPLTYTKISHAKMPNSGRDVDNGCQRIKGGTSKFPNSPCGNKVWNNVTSRKSSIMCLKCMDLKSGLQAANILSSLKGLSLEDVTGGYYNRYFSPQNSIHRIAYTYDTLPKEQYVEVEEKVDVEIEEKVNMEIEEKVDEEIEEKVDEEKVDEKVEEEKVDEKVEEKVDAEVEEIEEKKIVIRDTPEYILPVRKLMPINGYTVNEARTYPHQEHIRSIGGSIFLRGEQGNGLHLSQSNSGQIDRNGIRKRPHRFHKS